MRRCSSKKLNNNIVNCVGLGFTINFPGWFSSDEYRSDMDDDQDLVADINSDTLIRIVKFLKRGEASGPDNMHNEGLRLGTTTSLFHTAFSYLLTNWLAYLYGRIQSPRPDVMPDRREGITRVAGFVFACIDTQAS